MLSRLWSSEGKTEGQSGEGKLVWECAIHLAAFQLCGLGQFHFFEVSTVSPVKWR